MAKLFSSTAPSIITIDSTMDIEHDDQHNSSTETKSKDINNSGLVNDRCDRTRRWKGIALIMISVTVTLLALTSFFFHEWRETNLKEGLTLEIMKDQSETIRNMTMDGCKSNMTLIEIDSDQTDSNMTLVDQNNREMLSYCPDADYVAGGGSTGINACAQCNYLLIRLYGCGYGCSRSYNRPYYSRSQRKYFCYCFCGLEGTWLKYY